MKVEAMPSDEEIFEWLEYTGHMTMIPEREWFWKLQGCHPEEDDSLIETPDGPMKYGDLYLIWAAQKGIELVRYDVESPKRATEAPESTQSDLGTHGGLREGAGRKKRSEELADVRKTLRLTPQEYEDSLALLQEGESWSDMVRRLIRIKSSAQKYLSTRKTPES